MFELPPGRLSRLFSQVRRINLRRARQRRGWEGSIDRGPAKTAAPGLQAQDDCGASSAPEATSRFCVSRAFAGFAPLRRGRRTSCAGHGVSPWLAPRPCARPRSGMAVHRSSHVTPFDFGFVLKLLREVAVPAQTAGEAAQRVGQVAIGGAGDARRGGLVHAAHRDRAKGQVRAQATAAFCRTERAGHRAAVSAGTAVKKTAQGVPCSALAAGCQGGLQRGQARIAVVFGERKWLASAAHVGPVQP